MPVHQLADRVDLGPLEAVAGTLREVELLDPQVEIRRAARHVLPASPSSRPCGRLLQVGDQADQGPQGVAGRGQGLPGAQVPSVSMSSTSRSKSVDCSTRTGSMSKVTRRTGEKMASTGITPIVVIRLLRSAET